MRRCSARPYDREERARGGCCSRRIHVHRQPHTPRAGVDIADTRMGGPRSSATACSQRRRPRQGRWEHHRVVRLQGRCGSIGGESACTPAARTRTRYDAVGRSSRLILAPVPPSVAPGPPALCRRPWPLPRASPRSKRLAPPRRTPALSSLPVARAHARASGVESARRAQQARGGERRVRPPRRRCARLGARGVARPASTRLYHRSWPAAAVIGHSFDLRIEQASSARVPRHCARPAHRATTRRGRTLPARRAPRDRLRCSSRVVGEGATPSASAVRRRGAVPPCGGSRVPPNKGGRRCSGGEGCGERMNAPTGSDEEQRSRS